MATNIIEWSEILDKIIRGVPVDYSHVIINGAFDINGSNIPKNNEKFIIKSLIKITFSRINGKVNFSNAAFEKSINFEGTYFNEDAEFMASQFNEDARFLASVFKKNVYFKDSQFKKAANFKGSEFGINLYDAADFARIRFDNDAIFENCKFNGSAFFEYSRFDKATHISDSRFKKYMKLDGVRFKEDAFFDRCTFDGTISLIGAKYEILHIEWNYIYKPRKNFLKFWESGTIKLEWDDTAFLSIIDNFKKMGFFEDADNCYYHYRIERLFRKVNVIYKPIDFIFWISYGYGTKPIWPIGWFLLINLVFFFIYAFRPELIGIKMAFSPVEAFNNSSTIHLSGTQLVGTPNYPALGMIPYWAFTAERLFGSFFFALFLVSVGRMIIR